MTIKDFSKLPWTCRNDSTYKDCSIYDANGYHIADMWNHDGNFIADVVTVLACPGLLAIINGEWWTIEIDVDGEVVTFADYANDDLAVALHMAAEYLRVS